MLVPTAAANRVQHNPLKAVVFTDRPVSTFGSREFWQQLLCQVHVVCYRIVGGALIYPQISYFSIATFLD